MEQQVLQLVQQTQFHRPLVQVLKGLLIAPMFPVVFRTCPTTSYWSMAGGGGGPVLVGALIGAGIGSKFND